jgi:hypothetical protein
VGLSNPRKLHARSSRSGNIPLTRRHAPPWCVGLGTIQSKLYISHPLPQSLQFRRKKYLQCSAMQLRICLVFCLTEMRTDQKTRISFKPSNVFTRGTTSSLKCVLLPPRQPKRGSPALRVELAQWMVPSRRESYELQTAITAIYLLSSIEKIMQGYRTEIVMLVTL